MEAPTAARTVFVLYAGLGRSKQSGLRPGNKVPAPDFETNVHKETGQAGTSLKTKKVNTYP
jgi:hypothetical protein